MTTAAHLTAARLLERGASELSRVGVSEPRWEAELLLRHAMGCSRASLLASLREPVAPETSGYFFQLVERRRGRVPIQYILGTQEFYGLSFRVTPGVLIPRPETEGIVEQAIEELRERPEAVVADVGCGTGCIGLSLAHAMPGVRVVALDVSPAALAVARENAKRLGLERRVRFLSGDLLEPVLDRCESVDAVLSNPPYVPDDELATLEPEVAEHEPRLALSGGADGLSVIRKLLPQAARALRPGGFLFIEMGMGQDARVADLVGESGLDVVRVARDLAGIPRILVARGR